MSVLAALTLLVTYLAAKYAQVSRHMYRSGFQGTSHL